MVRFKLTLMTNVVVFLLSHHVCLIFFFLVLFTFVYFHHLVLCIYLLILLYFCFVIYVEKIMGGRFMSNMVVVFLSLNYIHVLLFYLLLLFRRFFNGFCCYCWLFLEKISMWVFVFSFICSWSAIQRVYRILCFFDCKINCYTLSNAHRLNNSKNIIIFDIWIKYFSHYFSLCLYFSFFALMISNWGKFKCCFCIHV